MNEMIREESPAPQCNEMDLAKLGKNIRKARKALKISQAALADMCGLCRTYVSDVERGARNLSFGSLSKLARALGTKVSQLTRHGDSEVFRAVKSNTDQANHINQRLQRSVN
jgi:transcriptional regulator with XRE-family HTH domain